MPPETPQKLADHLESLRNEHVAHRNDLADRYEQLPVSDPRRVTARHLKAIASATYLSAVFLSQGLAEPRWWSQTFPDIPAFASLAGGEPPPVIKDELEDFQVLMATGLIRETFSVFEAGIRRLVRVIDPGACRGATAEAQTVLAWFFTRLRTSGWQYSRGEEDAFLDLFRTIRNTMHNNAAFFHPKHPVLEITWRGNKYLFDHGQVPAIADWALWVSMSSEMGQLNREVMEAPFTAALPPIL